MPIQTENGLMLTYEDYIKIPEDGRRHEIIDGRHFVNPAPRTRHQFILSNVHDALRPLRRSGRARVAFAPIAVQLTEFGSSTSDPIEVSGIGSSSCWHRNRLHAWTRTPSSGQTPSRGRVQSFVAGSLV